MIRVGSSWESNFTGIPYSQLEPTRIIQKFASLSIGWELIYLKCALGFVIRARSRILLAGLAPRSRSFQREGCARVRCSPSAFRRIVISLLSVGGYNHTIPAEFPYEQRQAAKRPPRPQDAGRCHHVFGERAGECATRCVHRPVQLHLLETRCRR